jgi:hypothetical protein
MEINLTNHEIFKEISSSTVTCRIHYHHLSSCIINSLAKKIRMKRILFVCVVIFYSCDDNDTNLLITSKHNTKTVGQSTVYLKNGWNIDHSLALEQFEIHQRSDGMGDAYFKAIGEGDYTIYILGYENNVKVEAWKKIRISKSSGHLVKATLDLN